MTQRYRNNQPPYQQARRPRPGTTSARPRYSGTDYDGDEPATAPAPDAPAPSGGCDTTSSDSGGAGGCD